MGNNPLNLWNKMTMISRYVYTYKLIQTDIEYHYIC
jgi:hypothetical protein